MVEISEKNKFLEVFSQKLFNGESCTLWHRAIRCTKYKFRNFGNNRVADKIQKIRKKHFFKKFKCCVSFSSLRCAVTHKIRLTYAILCLVPNNMLRKQVKKLQRVFDTHGSLRWCVSRCQIAWMFFFLQCRFTSESSPRSKRNIKEKRH